MCIRDRLKEELVELGYERTGQVELPGQFSVRGGIIDIYPLTEDNPWRIELWDDCLLYTSHPCGSPG